MIGSRVGNWVLTDVVGTGGMGTVYKARAFDPRPDGPAVAAVKILTHPVARDPAFLQRFPAEMLALRRLSHPNIARFYDGGVHAGAAYYASEFVDGVDCGTLLKRGDKAAPDWRTAVFILAVQAARAVKHAHHRSLLHRDLKPSNLIVTADGRLKVTDLGVAKVYNLSPLALPPDPFGTAGFLAPEHFTGKPLTRRSDLYALGGVVYALVTGRPPVQAGTPAEFMHKHCYMLPDRPANFVPKLPPDVDDLICGLLAKDPNRRPASAAAFLEDVDRIRGKLERKGDRPPAPPDADNPTATHAPLTGAAAGPRPGAGVRPRAVRAAVAGGLLLLVVGGILFAFFRPRPAAADLYAAAAPLMQSENPADWDRAWDDYLDPISRHHPGAYAAEIDDARAKIFDRKSAARGVQQGGQAKYATEPERLYHRGLGQARTGDFAAARRTWAAVAAAFADIPAAARWVRAARAGADELDRVGKPGAGAADPAAAAAALDAVFDAVRKLRSGGRNAEAEAMLNAIADLYADDPAAAGRVRDARK